MLVYQRVTQNLMLVLEDLWHILGWIQCLDGHHSSSFHIGPCKEINRGLCWSIFKEKKGGNFTKSSQFLFIQLLHLLYFLTASKSNYASEYSFLLSSNYHGPWPWEKIPEPPFALHYSDASRVFQGTSSVHFPFISLQSFPPKETTIAILHLKTSQKEPNKYTPWN